MFPTATIAMIPKKQPRETRVRIRRIGGLHAWLRLRAAYSFPCLAGKLVEPGTNSKHTLARPGRPCQRHLDPAERGRGLVPVVEWRPAPDPPIPPPPLPNL